MVDEYTSNAPQEGEGGGTDQGEGQESQLTPEQIAQLKQEREELAAKAAEADARAKQAERLAELAFNSAYTSDQGRGESTPPDPEINYDDIDTDDPKALLTKMDELVERKLAKEREAMLSSYTSNTAQQEQRWGELNKMKEKEELLHAGLVDIIPEVETQLQEWGVQAQALAKPGTYTSVAYHILGKRLVEEKMLEARRAPNLSNGSGRYSSEGRPSSESHFSPEEVAFVRSKFGDAVDERDLEFFSSNREFTADDFEALEAKKGRK